jgi:uncharacterized Ntn-hydrolase superfamily protein
MTVLVTPQAFGTWSIILIDTRTGEIGIGAATCFEIDLTTTNPVMLVEVGGAISQHSPDFTGIKRMLLHQGLQGGVSPDEIIADTLEELDQVDPFLSPNSQFGIVDIIGRRANFSGAFTLGDQWVGALSGGTQNLAYSIQGNLLTGEPVVKMAEEAALLTDGDVAERLMAAMEAARSMGGDGRCSCGSSTTSCGSPPAQFLKTVHAGYMMVSRPGD